MFTGQGAGPIGPDHVSKRLQHLVHHAGLVWIRVHGLRRTTASLALQNGTDIATVSERLGHSNINVKARIYLHTSGSLRDHARFRAWRDRVPNWIVKFLHGTH